MVLVGHVTKDGGLAGPRVLEHVVDTVLAFEGDRHHALRLLRAVKHRFGATDQLGLFEMTEGGMIGVPDPSRLFLADRRKGVSGSVVVPTMEGHRPLLVELQALVTPSRLASPRRSAQGLDSGRLSLLLAVLGERAGFSFAEADVYALAVGGVKVAEPAADLGVALALASALAGRALPADWSSAARSGSAASCARSPRPTAAWPRPPASGSAGPCCPASAPEPPDGIVALRVGTLAEAIEAAGLTVETGGPGRPTAGRRSVRRRRPPGRRAGEPGDRGDDRGRRPGCGPSIASEIPDTDPRRHPRRPLLTRPVTGRRRPAAVNEV